MAVSNINNGVAARRLQKVLETQVNESETSSYEVGEQRERNHRYYTLQPLGNEQRGRSHYISPDVLDTVEGKKAVFAETFLSARDVVRFTRTRFGQEAEAKTAYVNKTFKRNQYERMFRDGWHDAFVAKRMVVIVDWEEDTKERVVQLNQTPVQALQQQLQQMGEDLVDIDWSQARVTTVPNIMGGQQQYISGPVTLLLDDSYVKYTLVQPERYFRDPNATYVDEAEWNSVEEDLSRGQLIERGFDREQVENLSMDYRFRSDEEDAARKRHDGSWNRRQQHNRNNSQELVSYYRTWTWLMFDDEMVANLDLDFEWDGEYRLYEVHWAQGEILRREDGHHAVREVPEVPAFEWSEMKISHSENGICTADVVAHTQKTTSTLKRLIIDNQQIANSSRMGVLKGGLVNPRDVLVNKLGAPLWLKRADALVDIPTPQLSPLTLQTVGLMKQDSEERSGLSGLAKGMNTDAVKYQNADNMIERLTTAGQRRVTMAARDFANTFLVPLAQYTVHLAMRNDRGRDQIEVGGQLVPVVPASWQDEDLRMDVAVALTPDESQRMAERLLLVHNVLSSDPQMALAYGVRQKHALLDQIMDMLGIADSSPYMLAPSSPEFQQAAMQQAQAAQQQQQMQGRMLGVQMGHIQAQTQNLQTDNVLNFQKHQWERTQGMWQNLQDEERLEHDMEIDRDKIEIDRRRFAAG